MAPSTITASVSKELLKLYPSEGHALAKLSLLRAKLTLPKETVHVISDIHGEFKKLRHVVNNGSGSLRPLVEQLFRNRLSDAERGTLLNLIYYPREAFMLIEPMLSEPDTKRAFLEKTILQEVEILLALAEGKTEERLSQVFPAPYTEVFRELLAGGMERRSSGYMQALIDEFHAQGRELDFLRMFARAIRNLLFSELIVAGDLGDRGPRIDLVVEYLMQQPRVSIVWGNHDASWMGACLGHEACIATVVRISLRYQRLSQLEEGYGISLSPLEELAESVYGQDPARQFPCKGEAGRDALLLSRMQKAIAMIQFKLEGQLIQRNPEFKLEHRNLLHRIDAKDGTVTVDGKTHAMLDLSFPTIDWSRPYELSDEEKRCVERLRRSFIESASLWRHMKYVREHGHMYLVRDSNLIFHACVPARTDGNFVSFPIDGVQYSGKALFDAFSRVVLRAYREMRQKDLDLLWYLWGGPLSPWFGKDKMATFETYFIADKAVHKETKDPYFSLIHEVDFCNRALIEFGVDAELGLIVNGHVPVKIEEGEDPVKRSGKAVTIDGAFSEAYGDKGYTLILDARGTYLAQHHHFESVSDAITQHKDMVPSIRVLREFKAPRLVGDTEEGAEMRDEMVLLLELLTCYP